MIFVITNLSHAYDFEVFDNVNFQFNNNLIKLDGKNGSGKSTLLKIISGKVKKTSGYYYVNNSKVSQNYISTHSVLVDQDVNLFLEKNVDYNIKKLGKKNSILINEFGFSDKLKTRVSELSGGWKKKLMLMLAFSLEPEILLLDEYSNYLDHDFIAFINDKIIEYSKKHLVIYADHNQDIGGLTKKIDESDHISLVENEKKIENIKIYKPSFSFFTIFSFLIFAILTILTQFFFTIYDTNSSEIVASYYAKNNLWFQMTTIDFDNQNYNCFYVNHFDYGSDLNCIMYAENKFFPLTKESSITKNNECYVFSNYEEYYESTLKINDVEYFVKGIIFLDVNKYVDSEIIECFNSIVIVGKIGYYNMKCVSVCGQDLINLAKNNQIVYTNKPSVPYFSSYYIAFEVIFFVFLSLFLLFSFLLNKRKFNIMLSYMNSKYKLITREFLGIVILSIIILTISYVSSFFISIQYYKTIDDLKIYDMSFIRPYKFTSLFSVLILFSSFVESFILFQKIK